MLRKGHSVLGAFIDALTWKEALATITRWADKRESRYICICNVHSVITTTRNPAFRSIVNSADLATPDGAPVAWALRKFGFPAQERINGPDLMWKYLEQAELLGQSVFLYGSTDATLERLKERIAQTFPALRVAGAYAPPFRALSAEEDEAEVEMINRSGAQVVFVGLGCPKQEQWMAAHRGRIQAVMLGVGAAFDYHAGTKRRAPIWWQNHGLEWLYRLGTEPHRLMKRYVVTNTLFIFGFSRQLLRDKMLDK
jgi:N-acetylglucosaminyldiphosphoundecaprenol N-acetyl-beta-D-mannosaminyltransferase